MARGLRAAPRSPQCFVEKVELGSVRCARAHPEAKRGGWRARDGGAPGGSSPRRWGPSSLGGSSCGFRVRARTSPPTVRSMARCASSREKPEAIETGDNLLRGHVTLHRDEHEIDEPVRAPGSRHRNQQVVGAVRGGGQGDPRGGVTAPQALPDESNPEGEDGGDPEETVASGHSEANEDAASQVGPGEQEAEGGKPRRDAPLRAAFWCQEWRVGSRRLRRHGTSQAGVGPPAPSL